MKPKYLFPALIATIIAVQSCNKDVPPQPEFYTDPTTLVQQSSYGWLIFNSPQELDNVLNHLKYEDSVYEASHQTWAGTVNTTMSQEQIDSIFNFNNYETEHAYISFENTKNGFISLRHQLSFEEDLWLAQNTLTENSVLPDHPLNVEGFGSLVNSTGEYQVGNEVVFNSRDGLSILVHQDSLSPSLISKIRTLTINDSIHIEFVDTLSGQLAMDMARSATPTKKFGNFKYNDGNTHFSFKSSIVLWRWNPDPILCKYKNKEVTKPKISVGINDYVYGKSRVHNPMFAKKTVSVVMKYFESKSSGGHKVVIKEMASDTYLQLLSHDEHCFNSPNKYFSSPSSINYKLVKKYKHSEATSWGHWDVKMLNGLSYTDFYLEGTYLFTLTHAW
jgi:hypothetical protein